MTKVIHILQENINVNVNILQFKLKLDLKLINIISGTVSRIWWNLKPSSGLRNILVQFGVRNWLCRVGSDCARSDSAHNRVRSLPPSFPSRLTNNIVETWKLKLILIIERAGNQFIRLEWQLKEVVLKSSVKIIKIKLKKLSKSGSNGHKNVSKVQQRSSQLLQSEVTLLSFRPLKLFP